MVEINEYLKIVELNGKKVIQCKCGHVIGPANENFKLYAIRRDFPIQRAGPWVATYKKESPFVFREFYCPKCKRLLEVEVALNDMPVLWDYQPRI